MLANIIFDAVLVLMMLIGVIVGAKRGFVRTVAKPVKLALSIWLSFSLSGFFGEKLIKPAISSPITSKITSFLIEKYSYVTAATSGELPLVVRIAAAMANVDPALIGSEGEQYIVTLVNEITDPVVTLISVVLAFLILSIVLRLVLSLLLWLLESMVDDGFIGVANRIVGCVITFALSVVVCWCVVALSDFVFHIPAISSMVWVSEFSGGFVYKFFESISPIDLLLSF